MFSGGGTCGGTGGKGDGDVGANGNKLLALRGSTHVSLSDMGVLFPKWLGALFVDWWWGVVWMDVTRPAGARTS